MDFTALSRFELQTGAHDTPAEGLCVMEAVAWLEGLDHTDAPVCTCPVIAEFARNVNDWSPPVYRQTLVAEIPRLVGTNSPDYQPDRVGILFEEALSWWDRGERTSYDRLDRAQEAALALAYEAATDHLCQFLIFFDGTPLFWSRMRQTLVAMIQAGPNGGVTGDPEVRVREYERLVAA